MQSPKTFWLPALLALLAAGASAAPNGVVTVQATVHGGQVQPVYGGGHPHGPVYQHAPVHQQAPVYQHGPVYQQGHAHQPAPAYAQGVHPHAAPVQAACGAPRWHPQVRYMPGQVVWRKGSLWMARRVSARVYNENSPPEWTPQYWVQALCR
jgi:hypothetical protein